jgi:hypothetical protein
MKPLKATAMDHSHYVRLSLFAEPPAGTTLEDVLNPEYWANHTQRLKRGAVIEVLSEDSLLDCDLRVLKVGPTYAHVRLLRNYVESASVSAPSVLHEDVKVSFGGKQDRWRIIHRDAVVQSGMETKAEAEKAAEEYKLKISV